MMQALRDALLLGQTEEKAAVTTILYIEDNLENVALVRRYLSAIDCTLYEANDGGTGIHAAFDTQPDMILLDIYLPDINGLEVAEQLRAIPELSHIPLVALTTDDSLELKRACLESNFSAVLHKPVRPQQLLGIIEEMTA
jgi:CheY-like chemotaxis protein